MGVARSAPQGAYLYHADFIYSLLLLRIRKGTRAFFVLRAKPPFLLLLLRHSAKSSIAQHECRATSPYLVTRLNLPHAIVMRLYTNTDNAVIIPFEKVGPVGLFTQR